MYAYPPWLEVAIEKIALPDGRVVDEFLQLRARDFVVVVAFTEDGDIVTIWSYKHGPRRVSLALPAGLIDHDEDPATAARRELLEETGYEVVSLEPIGRFVVESNYGLNTEHAFVGRGARKVHEPMSGDLEQIVVELHSPADLLTAVRNGDVAQLSSAAAIGIALALYAADPGAKTRGAFDPRDE